MAKGEKRKDVYYCVFRQDAKGAYDIGSGKERVLYSVNWANRPRSRKEEIVMMAVGLTRGNEIYSKAGIAPHQMEVFYGPLEKKAVVYSVLSDDNSPENH